jgi:hypothetical protein
MLSLWSKTGLTRAGSQGSLNEEAQGTNATALDASTISAATSEYAVSHGFVFVSDQFQLFPFASIVLIC